MLAITAQWTKTDLQKFHSFKKFLSVQTWCTYPLSDATCSDELWQICPTLGRFALQIFFRCCKISFQKLAVFEESLRKTLQLSLRQILVQEKHLRWLIVTHKQSTHDLPAWRMLVMMPDAKIHMGVTSWCRCGQAHFSPREMGGNRHCMILQPAGHHTLWTLTHIPTQKSLTASATQIVFAVSWAAIFHSLSISAWWALERWTCINLNIPFHSPTQRSGKMQNQNKIFSSPNCPGSGEESRSTKQKQVNTSLQDTCTYILIAGSYLHPLHHVLH